MRVAENNRNTELWNDMKKRIIKSERAKTISRYFGDCKKEIEVVSSCIKNFFSTFLHCINQTKYHLA